MVQRAINERNINLVHGDIGTPDTVGETVCTPINGRLVAIAAYSASAISTNTTFDVVTNGTESHANAFTFTGGQGTNFGMLMEANARIYLNEGDGVALKTNGETTGTPAMVMTLVIAPE